MDTTALLNGLIEGKDLTAAETSGFLTALMRGEVSPIQAGGILTALRIKGEKPEEITGLIRAMREFMLKVNAPGAIDVVGTGGDNAGTFNISTAAALVAVGAGAKVAKHGNRAASSKCGSADVLEAFGVRIVLSKEEAERVFQEIGMVFLFAPAYHPAAKEVVAVRRELKVRTIFNVLGPFANPAGTARQVTGVPNLTIAKTMSEVATGLGYEHLLIVTSEDGMDEVSTSAPTHVYELRGANMQEWTIDPSGHGIAKPAEGALLGGTAEENSLIIRNILDGEKGPKRDIVVLNAACALYVAGIAADIAAGVALANDSIDGGKARDVLAALIRETNATV